MTREEIIRMALEAGMEDVIGSWCQECGCTDNMLERFAALVAAAERERVQKVYEDAATDAVRAASVSEREACAKVCDALAEGWKKYPGKDDSGFIALSNAGVTIRARGQA